MNNKKIGAAFEKRLVDVLAWNGYWAHFIVPDSRGAQPFDVIAVKNGLAYAFDCKTCVANSISIDRLEDNQVAAFEKWLRCGNTMPMVAIEHGGEIYLVEYGVLKERRRIKLCELKSLTASD